MITRSKLLVDRCKRGILGASAIPFAYKSDAFNFFLKSLSRGMTKEDAEIQFARRIKPDINGVYWIKY